MNRGEIFLASIPHPECYLIDAQHPDWAGSGLRLPSVVRCDRLFTLDNASFARRLGALTDATMSEVSECLKAALAIA